MNDPTRAAVSHPVLKQPPLLTSGTVTPEAVSEWESACQQYFLHSKGITDANRVSLVAAGFQDRLIQAWWKSNNATLAPLSWDDFVSEFRAQFLDDNWDINLRMSLLRMRQKPGETFAVFIRRFEMQNALLAGTTRHLSDTTLRAEITARLSARLQLHANSASVTAIPSYNIWKKAMFTEDKDWSEKRAAEADKLLALHARALKLNNPNSSNTNAARAPRPALPPPASSSSFPKIPTLTEDECTLLRTHRGCYKCRKFYAGHIGTSCTDWPSRPYQPLTLADALAAQKRFEGSNVKKATKVAALSATVEDVPEDDQDRDSDDDDLAYTPVPIAALYARSTCALSNDLEDAWDSECVPPSASPPDSPTPPVHLVWNASISSAAPGTQFPALSGILIDTGSPANLISASEVERLNLRRRPLARPQSFTTAFDGSETEASEWVKFQVSLSDGSYVSRAVRAIVVPSLCFPVILGIPFLDQNCLLEYEHLQARLQLSVHRDLLKQITMDVPRTPACRAAGPEAIAAVRTRVEELAFVESLKLADAEFKRRFADCFPADIPHLDHLPTDSYHEINLKDANMTIVRRQYDCPKKYREAFK
ncbi:hypothetical protein K466DRAFT_609598, partial [Polyporus arcularius HHB13444]